MITSVDWIFSNEAFYRFSITAIGDIITIKAKGIRAYLKTGTTTKGFECDNLEASLSGDLFNSGFEALIEKLNKFLRI